MNLNQKIIAVNFTFALTGGMWLRFADESVSYVSFDEIKRAKGQTEFDRLYRIAYANGMTGMWYNAANGGNVYANGEMVNA